MINQAVSLQENLLTVEQSAELAGVSVETIDKYCQIGVLIPVAVNGLEHFAEADIRALFYTKPKENPSRDSAQTFFSENSAKVQGDLPAAHLVVAQEITTPPNTPLSEEQVPLLSELVGATSQEAAKDPAGLDIQAVQPPDSSHTENSAHLAVTASLREQIEALKQERDWLRQRVESLEARSEREQMLLLSESETVRRLVSKESLTRRIISSLRLPWVEVK